MHLIGCKRTVVSFLSTGSNEERAAMLKALHQSESLFSRYYLNEEFNDIMFTFELRDDIVIGQPFRYFIYSFLTYRFEEFSLIDSFQEINICFSLFCLLKYNKYRQSIKISIRVKTI